MAQTSYGVAFSITLLINHFHNYKNQSIDDLFWYTYNENIKDFYFDR